MASAYYRVVKRDGIFYKIYINAQSQDVGEIPVRNDNQIAGAIDRSEIFAQRLNAVYASARNRELELVRKRAAKNIQSAREKLGFLNFEKLVADSQEMFYDPNYLVSLRRSINGIIASTPSASSVRDELVSLEERMRDWLGGVRILSSGAYGTVGATNLDGAGAGTDTSKKALVVKFPNTRDQDLEHEYVVGTRMNMVRELQLAPNYVYTYTRFGCGEGAKMVSSKRDKKEMGGFCNGSPNTGTTYLAIENISNSRTLHDVLIQENLNFREFISIMLQIFFAETTVVLHPKLEFSHNDLHTGNILVKKEDRYHDFWSPYRVTKAQIIYVKTLGRIPFIIDYGQASVRTDCGTYIGPNPADIQDEKFRGQPWFMHDLYKFFIFCLYNLLGERDPRTLTSELRQVIKFLVTIFARGVIKVPFAITDAVSNFENRTQQSGPNQFLFARLNYLDPQANNPIKIFDGIKTILKEGGFNLPEVYRIEENQGAEDKNKGASGTIPSDIKVLSCPNNFCSPRKGVDEVGADNVALDYLQLCYQGRNINSTKGRQRTAIMKKFTDAEREAREMVDYYLGLVQELIRSKLFRELASDTSTTVTAEKVKIYPEIKKYIDDPTLNKVVQIFYEGLVLIWTGLTRLADLNHIGLCIGLGKEAREIYNYVNSDVPKLNDYAEGGRQLQEILLRKSRSDPSFFTNISSQLMAALPFYLNIISASIKPRQVANRSKAANKKAQRRENTTEVEGSETESE